jgi:hypothetical protein
VGDYLVSIEAIVEMVLLGGHTRIAVKVYEESCCIVEPVLPTPG